MAARRTVVGPVVVLPDATTGLIKYYYQGAVLPDGLDGKRVASAIADGLVSEEVDAGEMTIEDLRVDLAGDRLRAANDPVLVGTSDEGDKRPARTGNKAAWAEYRGLTGEQAEGVTLEQLKDDEFMSSYWPPASPGQPQS